MNANVIKKPIILIFDDEYQDGNRRKEVIEKLLQRNFEIGRIKCLDYFSNESWERGEIAVFVMINDIIQINPDLLIFDLDLRGLGEWTDGIKLMRKIKNSSDLIWSKPKLVVSSFVKMAVQDLDSLNIPKENRFDWRTLRDNDSIKRDFSLIVDSVANSQIKRI